MNSVYLLCKLQHIRLALIGILTVYTVVTLANAWGNSCSNLCFWVEISIFCLGLSAIGFVTGIPYQQKGLGAEFGAKFSALVGGVITIVGFFVFLQNAEVSGGVLLSLLFATFFYGPVGAGIGLISGLIGSYLGGEVGRRGYFAEWY